MERERESRYGEVEDDGSTKTECREPDTGLSIAKRVKRSSSSDAWGGVVAFRPCSSENFPNAVIDVMSPTAWQEDVTAK